MECLLIGWGDFGNLKSMKLIIGLEEEGPPGIRNGHGHKMESKTYSISFTTGGLFLFESVNFASLYLRLHNWEDVVDVVMSNNSLQTRTQSSLQRLSREIVSRVRLLNIDELKFLVESTNQDQRCILWIAICRRYQFIADFFLEVVRERFLTLANNLSYDDFDSFFNKKSEWHSELDKIKPSTRAKLRQVLFKILREAGILGPRGEILHQILSPSLINAIAQGNPNELFYFPVFESEMPRINNEH